MHTKLAYDAPFVETDDHDFGCERTHSRYHFMNADDIEAHADVSQCPGLARSPGGRLTASIDSNTEVRVVPPDDNGQRAQFLVCNKKTGHCDNKANGWFEAQVIKPSDILYQDGYVYIAQDGGGVVLATQQ